MKRKIQKNSYGKWYFRVTTLVCVISILLAWIAGVKYHISHIILLLSKVLNSNIDSFIFISIAIGIFLSFFMLKYYKEPEIIWLLSLPITYKSIAIVKMNAILNGLLKVLVFIWAITIPWNTSLAEFFMWCGIMLCAMFSFIVGITIGMCCSFCIFIISKKFMLSYLLNAMLIGICIVFTYSIQLPILSVKSLYILSIALVIVFLVMREIIFILFGKILAISNQVVEKDESKVRGESSVNINLKRQTLFGAILKKEIQYYKRESQYIVQFVIMLVLLTMVIAQKAQEKNLIMLGAYVLLFSIPFNLCGLVSVFSFGAEFSLLQTIFIVRGKILPYYYVKILLPFIICFLPITIIYLIFVIVSGEPFVFTVWWQLEFLLFYYALFATATSCFFLKTDENNLVLTRGVKILGMILYYLLGLAVPILFSFYKENLLHRFPLILGIYLAVQLVYSLIISIAAPIRLRKRIVS